MNTIFSQAVKITPYCHPELTKNTPDAIKWSKMGNKHIFQDITHSQLILMIPPYQVGLHDASLQICARNTTGPANIYIYIKYLVARFPLLNSRRVSAPGAAKTPVP